MFESVYGAEPAHAEIDSARGALVLEFGTHWCGFCQGIQADLRSVMQAYPEVKHVKVEDGKGRPLGRSFTVRLWPTLVFMKDGQVLRQVARPQRADIEAGLALL